MMPCRKITNDHYDDDHDDNDDDHDDNDDDHDDNNDDHNDNSSADKDKLQGAEQPRRLRGDSRNSVSGRKLGTIFFGSTIFILMMTRQECL